MKKQLHVHASFGTDCPYEAEAVIRKVAWAVLRLLPFIWMITGACAAQVTIHANGAAVPEQKVQILFLTTCRVVADEFHQPPNSLKDFHITLELGDPEERVSGDEATQAYVVYMNRWDEIQFATSASRLAMHHLLTKERKARIVEEILRRTAKIAPVQAATFRSSH